MKHDGSSRTRARPTDRRTRTARASARRCRFTCRGRRSRYRCVYRVVGCGRAGRCPCRQGCSRRADGAGRRRWRVRRVLVVEKRSRPTASAVRASAVSTPAARTTNQTCAASSPPSATVRSAPQAPARGNRSRSHARGARRHREGSSLRLRAPTSPERSRCSTRRSARSRAGRPTRPSSSWIATRANSRAAASRRSGPPPESSRSAPSAA